jgi:hypothetical protein
MQPYCKETESLKRLTQMVPKEKEILEDLRVDGKSRLTSEPQNWL